MPFSRAFLATNTDLCVFVSNDASHGLVETQFILYLNLASVSLSLQPGADPRGRAIWAIAPQKN